MESMMGNMIELERWLLRLVLQSLYGPGVAAWQRKAKRLLPLADAWFSGTRAETPD